MSTVTDNGPRPLRNAPMLLLRDDRAQLSFGERAALEGILCQLKPRLSVEIGSAVGGSLERIVFHSEETHSFDLQPARFQTGYVPHIGDSHELLAPWLETNHFRIVDFAFVDGDHSSAGVCADLLDLLDAPACERTVILVHDTANQDVRVGLQEVLAHPAVVYHEIDFIEGYKFAEGSFSGALWGGFGLIVTGDRETDGYGETPRQTLYVRRHHG